MQSVGQKKTKTFREHSNAYTIYIYIYIYIYISGGGELKIL